MRCYKVPWLEGSVDTDRWPTDEEVMQTLTTRDLYYAIPQARIAMVLRAVELSLYNAKVDLPQVPRTLSIEHLLPQKWQEHWPLPSDLSPEEQVERTAQRAERIHQDRQPDVDHDADELGPFEQRMAGQAEGTESGKQAAVEHGGPRSPSAYV